jgi:lipopolysaccharide/colanic/teichoic acid biosynthesis glycosyltransferase
MLILLVFFLGVANFAMNKAVLESDHPILDELPALFRSFDGRMPLVAEFVVLLAAMLMTANGYSGFAWGYLAYSAFGIATAWAIVSHRI